MPHAHAEHRNHRIASALGIPYEDARTLCRAERTLRRWHELECGDGNDRASWCLERDEATGKPYMVTYPHRGPTHRRLLPDRETGAIHRVRKVCERHGLYVYIQTDPRGCALYVSREPITASDYTRGTPCR